MADSPRTPDPGIARALESIRVQQYKFAPAGIGALRARNAAHDLSVRVTESGLELGLRPGNANEARVGLRLVAAERGGKRLELGPAAVTIADERAELRRGELPLVELPLVEWYVNDSRGVEQGLDLARDPLPGEGVLRFLLQTSGTLSPRIDDDGRGVAFHDASDALQMRFGSLVALDASHKALPARMLLAGGRLVYEVDDRGATYPITVDPLATSANFVSAIGPSSSPSDDRFSVSTAGDVNGDGFSDLLVGWFSGGNHFGNAAYLFLGSSNGLSAAPDWQAGDDTFFYVGMGVSVSTAGDVNGDGFDDILIGSTHGADGLEGQEGGAFLWLGSADFASRPDGTTQNADWSAESNQANAGNTFSPIPGLWIHPQFATSVATAGDLNGDGLADIVVGFPGHDVVTAPPNFVGREGVALVWLGSADFAARPNGTPLNADWRADGVGAGISYAAPVSDSLSLGASVSTAGDVNGDGYDDLIIGAPYVEGGPEGSNLGGAFVWLGSPGFATRPDGTLDNPDWSYRGLAAPGTNSFVGSAVANAGDVDGDGYADVVLTTWAQREVSLRFSGVELFRGNATTILENAPSFKLEETLPLPSPSLVSQLPLPAAATAGDVNGDGLADLVVGTNLTTNILGQYTGEVSVYLGRHGTVPSALPYGGFVGGSIDGFLGLNVATAGDVNGDGFSDVVASGNGLAQARAYHGAGDTITPSADFDSGVTYEGPNVGSPPGKGIGLGFAGDINGDGYSDFVLGAPFADAGDHFGPWVTDTGRFDVAYGGACGGLTCGPLRFAHQGSGAFDGEQQTEQYGWSVSGAGDVSGDGYADVIVGAPGYSSSAGQEGRARIYYGGLAGLYEATFTDLLGSEEPQARFGSAVASAGDVNGDGFADVIIGAPNEDSGGLSDNGVVYVYTGTSAGPANLFAWSKAGTRSNARLGGAVASAGDVNRDGYSDVIVGADGDGTSGEGAAYVYLGGPSGLASTAVWTGTGTSAGGAYGTSVASAGDVNADGYSDIIVGQPAFDFGPYASAAFVYPGSATGPSLAPSPTLHGDVVDYDRFGSGVSTAGDVNGDGFSDVIVGAQWHTGPLGFAQGRAYVFHGSAGGLATTPARTLEDCENAPCDFGRNVAGGGDLNGDGYADVLIGAYRSEVESVPDQGAVFAHFGNLGTGADRRPQQLIGLGGTPIELLGSALSVVDPVVTLRMRSPAGRARLRLESEFKLLGASFDGVGTTLSPYLDPGVVGGPFGALFANPVSVVINQRYHWRARMRSANPYFPRSRWFSLPGNAPSEMDMRGALALDADSDGVPDPIDNCATVANADQADGDADAVGNVCDSCTTRSNPRVAADFVATNAWATLTGLQRDDDHDGFGNKCDAKFPGVAGTLVGSGDLTQFRSANGKNRTLDICGTTGTRPCAIFDLDESSLLIGTPDLSQFRLLNGKAPGPKCATCPLICTAGASGTCF